MMFAHSPDGVPLSIVYDDLLYYYVTNIQGDVVAILDATGAEVVTYTYDAWGNILTIGGSKATSLGQDNPLRYRGYVYDQETGLYYLQSRYYDPEVGRWINADGAMSDVGSDIRGYNLFAYCMNNPVNMSDSAGNWPTWNDIITFGKKAVDVIVQTVVSVASPVVTIIGKALHYSRNVLNNTSYTENELIEKGYTKEPASSDKFHQNNQLNGERNRKYVIGDWLSSEVVYYSDGTLNTTSEDMGTFNVYSGDNPALNIIVHGLFDVVPYMIWGNSSEDSTTLVDRIIMIWE